MASTGDLQLAEDAVQDALVDAMRTWPTTGLPDRPGAWLTTTARNRAVDRLRRGARGRERERLVRTTPPEPPEHSTWTAAPDEELALVFGCCHPALAGDAQVALTLRLVAGLPTERIARAFLVPVTTMQQRLVRAKRKVRAAHIAIRVPDDAALPGRLGPVLATILLVVDAGLDHGDDVVRREGVRLARRLADLMPDEPEVLGLLALVLLLEARVPARTEPGSGDHVPLDRQDRGRWDAALVEEGHALVRRCLRLDRPGPFQLQAAIQAVHTDAARAADTDWAQVLSLYDQLLALQPTPVVALNRAVAVARVVGHAEALSIVEALDLDGYQPFHAVRGHLRRACGDLAGARADDLRAAELAPNAGVRRHLRARAEG